MKTTVGYANGFVENLIDKKVHQKYLEKNPEGYCFIKRMVFKEKKVA